MNEYSEDKEKKPLEVLLMRMTEKKSLPAVFWQGKEYSYGEFLERILFWEQILQERGIIPGTVCGVLGDYSFETISLLFALMKKNTIVVPLYKNPQQELEKLIKISGVQELFDFEDGNSWTLRSIFPKNSNELIQSFLSRSHPGLVVFTSGSTGEPKGILHDGHLVIKKFLEPRKPWRTILFLLFDHFGGLNTLFSIFASGGMAVCLEDRSPSNVCENIEKAKATLLPTSPSFLNILLLSGSIVKYDLSSIELITYGTEIMAPSLLDKISKFFPQTKLKQTYGLSELGVLRSKSQQENSTWVKIGGEGFAIKVIDHTLWIQSEYNMVGYLNAQSPFDEEGWMCTGDQVEVQGEYLRILGRQSDLINVGGQKVFPAEVESVLQEDENVQDALVYGNPSPVMGEMVCAKVLLKYPEKKGDMQERLRRLCLQKLARFKMPVQISIASKEELMSIRFKKIRK